MSAVLTRQVTRRWILGPGGDSALALLWVPFAAAVWLVDAVPSRVAAVVAATLALSFAHQPLTLCLVYTDGEQFARRARLFTYAPMLMAALVVIGLWRAAPLLVVLAGAWNVAHTLRQRYGIVRIYGRKVDQTDGRTEHRMLWSWLAVVLAFVAADPDTGANIARAGLGGRNRAALDHLTHPGTVATVVLVGAVVVATGFTVRWVRLEMARPTVNAAKWIYLASTAALLAVAVIHPVAGFVGYVGSHAVEYVLIVRHRLATSRRAASPRPDPDRCPLRAVSPLAYLAVYGAGVVALVAALDRVGNQTLATSIVLVLGGLHLLYDGFIWKSTPRSRLIP